MTADATHERKRATAIGMGGICLAFAICMGTVPRVASATDDWPAYRHDAARSGITSGTLSMPLKASWIYHPAYEPQPAWGDSNPRPIGGWHGLIEQRRNHFDDAFHVVASDGAIYFGSSADGRVVSLDAKSGEMRWKALTGGPVRLAPSLWNGNVYFGSDDGYVYCLDSQDGSPQWTFRAAPRNQQVLGCGKMISLWPVRTGVLVDQGIAYFGAGIFPAEGVYMYAVDADDGTQIWCNDSGGEAPQSRISPQGYLLASKERLFTPMGRVSPASFDRKTGQLVSESYTEHIIGGTNAMLADDQLFTGTEQMVGYSQSSHRAQSAWLWSHQLIVAPDVFYAATGKELFAVKRSAYGKASLQRKKLLDRKRDLSRQIATAQRGPQDRLKQLESQLHSLNDEIKAAEAEMAAGEMWRIPCDCEDTLVLAGDTLLAGGDGKVMAVDAHSGNSVWTASLDGRARGLAVAQGRLFVSSDSGTIYCFAPDSAPDTVPIRQPVSDSPFGEEESNEAIIEAANRIVAQTGISQGYALLLGCESGRLAYELAKRTELQICCVEPDAKKAADARAALDAAGLYGSRVKIEQCDYSAIPYSDYFANLVVSESVIRTGRIPVEASEVVRMLKPVGGKICLGQPAGLDDSAKRIDADQLSEWLSSAEIEGAKISAEDGIWLDVERGPLPGAGSWTHQYAEPGNSTCSDDDLVRGPLGLLWFGNPGPQQMADRHRRAAAPLSINGRLFVLGEGEANRIGLGENSIMAYDAYNGVKLWERKVRGALRVSVTHDSGNSAVNDDSLFVAVGDSVLQLDAATGETKQTFTVPPAEDGSPRKWGYVAVVGNVLYGSRTVNGRTADCVFAMDLDSGQQLWRRETEGISQGSIAISNGRLHFAASSVSQEERERALAQKIKEVHRLSEDERAALLEKLKEASVYDVVALDSYSGEQLWEKPVEVTGAAGGQYWCSLGGICKDDTLLLFGVFLDGHYWTQFMSGQFESRQVVALSAKDGETSWRKNIGYRVRPLVIGDTLHAEPWAYDLKTGEQKMRVNPVTGQEEPWQFARPGHHCGAPAAAPHLMLFRSYNLGWYDLDNDYGTQHFGGQRPGCWINFIPANGLLMMPEASSGCMCPFPNICTVVFKPRTENRQWAYYSQTGPMTPVKHLALNLGAPGDRKDSNGTLWLGYPRPRGFLVLQYELALTTYPGYSNFNHDPERLQIESTNAPWVFRSGVSGIRQCKIPLAEAGDGRARYTVRLAFAELEHDAPGERVFDIKIQDDVVAKAFDVVERAGGKNRAFIAEFTGIEIDEELKIDFDAGSSRPDAGRLPVLQGIEVEREEVLSLGVTTPSFLLNNGEPKQTGELTIVNNRESDFVGNIQIESPPGFAVTVPTSTLRIPAGQRWQTSLTAALEPDAAPGKYDVVVRILRADGSVESQNETTLEHLGERRRVVLKVAADAAVIQRSPTTNTGTAAGLNVDGGDREMEDHHHGISYLRFTLPASGRPVSAMLRLFNGDNPSANSGQIRIVQGAWNEKTVTYDTRPDLGEVVAKIGPVAEFQTVELPLDLSLEGLTELNLAIDPTSCDGINYVSREGGKPAELVVEYVE